MGLRDSTTCWNGKSHSHGLFYLISIFLRLRVFQRVLQEYMSHWPLSRVSGEKTGVQYDSSLKAEEGSLDIIAIRTCDLSRVWLNQGVPSSFISSENDGELGSHPRWKPSGSSCFDYLVLPSTGETLWWKSTGSQREFAVYGRACPLILPLKPSDGTESQLTFKISKCHHVPCSIWIL